MVNHCAQAARPTGKHTSGQFGGEVAAMVHMKYITSHPPTYQMCGWQKVDHFLFHMFFALHLGTKLPTLVPLLVPAKPNQ